MWPLPALRGQCFLNERHQLDETWNVYLMTEINFILGKFEKIARQLTWNRVDWTVNNFRRYKVLSNMSGISIWKIISQFIRRINGQICWVKHVARHGLLAPFKANKCLMRLANTEKVWQNLTQRLPRISFWILILCKWALDSISNWRCNWK